MDAPTPLDAAPCPACGDAHPAAACAALRRAADAGAQPSGVPLRVQAAYVEARRALRADAPQAATRVLQWLIAHLAETQAANPGPTLSAKVEALREAGLLAPGMRADLFERALSSAPGPESAWALMTLVEHLLARMHQRPSR